MNEVFLSEVCDFQNGFAFKSTIFKEYGSPILRISNIQNERIDLKNLVYFDPNDLKENLDRYIVKPGELLIAMSGATTGKIGFNTTDIDFYLNQRVGKFIPKEKLNIKYLFYFLTTKVEENLRISAGAAQPNLSTEQIKNFKIPLPNLMEQERLVVILDNLFENIEIAKKATEEKLNSLSCLRASIVNNAFNGELVKD